MLKNPTERITAFSIVITAIAGLAELWVAFIFGSVAFIAAGIDNLTDTFTSTGILVGLRISKRRADSGHPYGHYQAETFTSAILSILLLVTGVRVAILAMDRLFSPSTLVSTTEPMIAALIAIVVFAVLARYKLKIGKRHNSPAVIADGYNSLGDAVSASAVFFGFVLVSFGYGWADPLVALGISTMIVRWSLKIGRDAIEIFMGASPGKHIIDKINEICLSTPGVLSCHQRRARRVGSRIIADVHIYVDSRISVAKGHEIATKVERRLKSQIEGLASVIVHVEPQKREKGR